MPVTITLTDEQIAQISGQAPSPAPAAADYDSPAFNLVLPTEAMFNAGASLPAAFAGYDLAACFALAAVGRNPKGGAVVSDYADLRKCYEKIERLRSGQDNDFSRAAKPYGAQPASWGCQQAAVLIGRDRSPVYDWRREGLDSTGFPEELNGIGSESFFSSWFKGGDTPSGR